MATLEQLKEQKKQTAAERKLAKAGQLSPAMEAQLLAEAQKRGLVASPRKAWDPADTPPEVYDKGSLRGGALELWTSKDFLICLAGPSECVAGETRLYDPMTGLHTPIEELYRKHIAPIVLTTDGPVQAEVPFLKGTARLYRVTMENGQSFVATAKHRMLTARGWVFVSSLRNGAAVPSCAQSLLPSNSAYCLSASRQDAPRSIRRERDCPGSYFADPSHPYDEQLRSAKDTYRGLAPLRSGVLEPVRACRSGDALACTEARSHAYQYADHPSNWHCLRQRTKTQHTGFRVSAGKPSHGAYSFRFGAQFPRSFSLQRPFDVQENRYVRTQGHRIGSFCTSTILYERAIEQVPPTRVTSVVFERVDRFFDLHVPVAEHYLAEGVWHHNTGKTFAALKKVNAMLWKYPGAQWVMLRKTYSSCITTCLQTYKRIVGMSRGETKSASGITTYGGEKPEWFDYPNGSRLWVGGLDNLAKVLSGERDGYYINQGEELDVAEIETITTRATGRGAIMPYTQVVIDANPSSPDHWIKTRADLKLLQSYHEDNPTLFDFAPEDVTGVTQEWPDIAYNGRVGRWTEQGRRTLAILDNLTGLRYSRLRKGLWVQAEGAVYEFDSLRHTVPAFRIPADWKRFRVIDFGFTNPFVCLWAARDPDGRLFVYREIYMTEMLVSELARQIRNLSADEKYEATICDHDAEDRATLAAEGIKNVAAWKSIKPGIDAVSNRLKIAGDGLPRLLFLRDSIDVPDERWDSPRKMPDAKLVEKKLPYRTTQEFGLYVWPQDVTGKPNKEVPVDEFNHGMDCCFVAGTMIETERGEIPIENVRVGDKVLTRKGFRKVLDAACTNKSAPVLTVSFSDGRTLTGTGNHPVFVAGKGFVPMDALRYNDTILDKQENIHWKLSNFRQKMSVSSVLSSTASFIAGILLQRVSPTGCTSARLWETSARAFRSCIATFTNFISAIFQTGTKSITRMKTRSITMRAIWNALLRWSIALCTNRLPVNVRRLLIKPAVQDSEQDFNRSRRSGTVPLKAWSGTKSTPLSLISEKASRLTIFASSALNRFSHRRKQQRDFALTPVELSTALNLEWITSRAFVPNACSLLSTTDTLRHSFAHANVVGYGAESAKFDIASSAELHSLFSRASRSVSADCRVLTKRELPDQQPVYNLTVEGEPEYFANGVLVHNCRYLVAYVDNIGKKKIRASS